MTPLFAKRLAEQNLAIAQAELVGPNDSIRISHLEKLFRHCPHAEIIYNDDPDVDQPVGFTICVEGCEKSEVTAPTLRECIDADIRKAAEVSE